MLCTSSLDLGTRFNHVFVEQNDEIPQSFLNVFHVIDNDILKNKDNPVHWLVPGRPSRESITSKRCRPHWEPF